MRRSAILLALVCCLINGFWSGPSWAQTLHLDPNGVDVMTGQFTFANPSISIGPAGSGGLSYGFLDATMPQRDAFFGTINQTNSSTSSWFTVSLATVTEVFPTNPTSGLPQKPVSSATGASLIQGTGPSGTSAFIYTTKEGIQYIFELSGEPWAQGNAMFDYVQAPYENQISNSGLLTRINYPNGDSVNITYKRFNIIQVKKNNCYNMGYYWRRQSIVSNTGYQLIYAYQSDALANNCESGDDLASVLAMSSVTLINNSEQYYDPTANGSGFSGNRLDGSGRPWPWLSFAGYAPCSPHSCAQPYTSLTISDANNDTWSYTLDPKYLQVTSIQLPGSSSPAVTNSYDYSTGQLSCYALGSACSVPSGNGYSIGATACPDGTHNCTLYNYSNYPSTVSQTNTTTAIDPAGGKTVYASSIVNSQILSVADPLGNTSNYQYVPNGSSNGAGLLQTVTHPEGDTVTYSYDVNNNVTSTVHAPKPGSTLPSIKTSAVFPTSCPNAWILCHQPTATIDAMGSETDYVYDQSNGNLLSVTLPAGANGIRPQTRYSYAAIHAGVMNASGSIVPAFSATYRQTGQSSCATGAAGSPCAISGDEVATTTAYGADGAANSLLPVSVTKTGAGVEAGATTSYTYDDLGDVLTAKDALSGATTLSVYDLLRRPVGAVSPAGDPAVGGSSPVYRATRTTYDGNSNPILVEQGTVPGQTAAQWTSGFSTFQKQAYAYDALGRKIQGNAEDGSGNSLSVTQFSYDAKGRPNCVAIRMTPSTYSALPTSACTQSGGTIDRITQTIYDLDDRALQTIQGVGTSLQVTVKTYAYTPNGQIQSVADGNGNQTGYVYDGFDRLKTVNWPTPRTAPSSTATLNKQYAFDNLGHKVSETSNGQTLSFAYDGLGRLTSEAEPVGTVSYSYSLANLTKTITWPDGASATYYTNQAGQPRSVQMAGSEVAHYSYDASGRLAWTTYGGTQAGTSGAIGAQYGYDGISRLNAFSTYLPGTPSANQQLGFSRNPAGQITTRTMTNGAYRFPDNVTQSTSYTANNLNQIVSAGAGTLSYDGAGNLSASGSASYAYDQENHLTGISGAATLAYDPDGRLASVAKGTTTRQFLYAGSQMIGEYDASGNLVARYVPDAAGVSALAQVTGSTRTYLLADQQGSVIAESDGAGNALAINTYDGYGMLGSGNDTAQRYQYTGQVWLPEVGLYYYKARVYSPTLRRFMQTDPKGYDAGMNVYAYVGGDPVNRDDPTGMLDGMGESSADVEISVVSTYLPTISAVYSSVAGVPGGGGLSHGPIPEIVVTAYRDWAEKNNKKTSPEAWFQFVTNVLPTLQIGCGGAGCHSNVGPTPPQPPIVFPSMSGPKDAPSGTRPIDSWGIPKDVIHDIKDSLGQGPRDWVGVAPNGDIIVVGPNGDAENEGNVSDYGWSLGKKK